MWRGLSEERVVKRLHQNNPEGNRSVGRPRLRWMDGPEEDGCHTLEDMCAQKRQLEDGHEGG